MNFTFETETEGEINFHDHTIENLPNNEFGFNIYRKEFSAARSIINLSFC